MQSILRKVIWFCLLAVPFVALYVASGHSLDIIDRGTSGLYFPFISGKNLLFRFLVEIAFFSWVALALADPKYRLQVRKSPLLIAYGIFMVILLLADMFGVDPARSFWSNFERMEGYVGHIHLFAYFVVLSAMLHTLTDYGRMFKAFIVSNVLVLVFGFGQLLGAPGYIFAKLFPTLATRFSQMFPIHMSQNRLDATLGNSEYFAIYCLMFIFILALMWQHNKGKKHTYWYPLLMALNLIALFYTGTRGTQIGFIVGTLMTLGLLVFRWFDSRWQMIAIGSSTVMYGVYVAAALFVNNNLLAYLAPISYLFVAVLLVSAIATYAKVKDSFRRIGAGIFILLLAIVILFQGIKTTQFVKNTPSLARLANISLTDITTASRLSIWKISLAAWKEHPILGYGQENFSTIFAAKFDPVKMSGLEPWYDRSHDVFFDWLVAAGALGLISYLSLYGVSMYLMWKRKNEMPLQEKAILTGMLAGYFVHNVFVFDNLTSYILFFFLLAYIAWRTGTRGGVEHGKVIAGDAFTMMYLPVIGIVALSSIYYFIYRPLHVNQLIVRALDVNRYIQQMSFPDLVKMQQDSFEEAVKMNTLGTEEAREQFYQTTVRMAQVTIPPEVSLEDKQKAIQALNYLILSARTDIESSYNAHQNDVRMLSIYGMFYIGIGDGVSAEKVLTRAHELAPNKQLISFDLIRAYLLQGKVNDAYALALQTYDIAPNYENAKTIYLLTSVYANKWKEAEDHVVASGGTVSFDSDTLNALVATKQIPAAIAYLNDLKKAQPDTAAQVDAYIKQLLASQKK